MRGTLRISMLAACLGMSFVVQAAPQKSATAPAVRLDDMAWQMLVDALQEAKTASPAVQAKVELEFAKQLDQDNKKNDELVVLNEAYLATLQSPPARYNTIGWVQGDIQRAMMKNLGPEPLEALLPRMDESQLGLAFDLLVTRYTADGNWGQAMSALRRAPKNEWFPFGPAVALMKARPPEDVGARREIFGMVYEIYKKRVIALGSLGEMIELDWKELPREQVVELIPVILRNAVRGEIYFVKRPTNAYEGLKAKLIPILRKLDPAKADEWENNEKQTFEQVREEGRYPNAAERRALQEAIREQPNPPAAPYEKLPGSPKPRSVAGCLENEPWCQQNRVEHAMESTRDHLLKNESELAKAGVSRGYWIALSQWKLDTDPVDPNQVIKTHWPSTLNWEAFSIMAARISPEYALQRVKEIPDPEIRLLTRTVLARGWLDHKPAFPCPSLHSYYHDEGACIPYQAYMPIQLFSWANDWD